MNESTMYIYDFIEPGYADTASWSSREAGTPVRVLVIAQDEERARELLEKEVGAGLEWETDEDPRPCLEKEARILHVSAAVSCPEPMTPNQLYEVPGIPRYDPIEEDHVAESTDLSGCMHVFFEGTSVNFDDIPEDANTRVTTRTILDPYIDGHRIFTMATIWFDGFPIGVVQRAGRGGRDAQGVFVTDAEYYVEAATYLMSLQVPEANTPREVHDPTVPLRNLNHFYGRFVFPSDLGPEGTKKRG
jgi:hypothetical protein